MEAINSILTLIFHWINAILAPVFYWINLVSNALGSVLLAPVGKLPGWLSNTIISAVMGVVLLILFKYTSNQKAIGRVRDGVKADMLALKLFKDELSVTFSSQGRLFLGAFKLLFHSLRPLAVMMLPVVFILAQMGAWYQFSPLGIDQDSVITMKLNGENDDPLPSVELIELDGAEISIGPVRIPAEQEIRWQITARQAGRGKLIFDVDGEQVEKELVIGEGLARISPIRPGWRWTDILLYPLEKPFPNDSTVQSISIEYPQRDSWTCGTNWWVIYFFVVSMIFALLFKPFLKVRI
jgi:hypothetical protein